MPGMEFLLSDEEVVLEGEQPLLLQAIWGPRSLTYSHIIIG
jgi:hypothetical protein